MSEDHPYCRVSEFAGRHNIRNMDAIGMVGTVTESVVYSRRTCRELIGQVSQSFTTHVPA